MLKQFQSAILLMALAGSLVLAGCQAPGAATQPAAMPKMAAVTSSQISFEGAPPPDGLRSVTLTWDDIDAGDSHQGSGTLIFRADGSAQWSSTVWSDTPHGGKVWHASFDVLDQNGAVLFTLSAITSDPLDGPPAPHAHFDHDYTFDPAKIQQIAKATQHYAG
jgi:Family of unknown function (DUF6294)